jgi:hypothetical protein
MNRYKERQLPDWMAGVREPFNELLAAADRKLERIKRGAPASDDEIAAALERLRQALLAATRAGMAMKGPK